MAPIDISPHTKAIAKALGVTYTDVRRFDITPSLVVVEVLKKRDGKLYVDPQTNEVAVETKTYGIKT